MEAQQTKNSHRKDRFNSFELSDSDLAQTSLKSTIIELQHFFPDQPLEFDKINDVVDESISKFENEDNSFVAIPVYNIKFIKKIRKDMQCTEQLRTIRSLLSDSKSSDEIVNWNMIVNSEKFNVSCYLSFVYALMKLIDVDQTDKINKDLAFNVGRTYVGLLSLPGAKTCMVWDRDLIIEYFKLLNFHEKLKTSDHYLELQIIQMLNEIKAVFNVVNCDQEDVQEKYIETICAILEHYLRSTSQTAIETVMCCYDNLESLCLRPLPDDEIEKIMYLIFCRTVELHFITSKRRQTLREKHGEAISDFFLYLLSTYSIKTKNVLLKFIKSLLSNPGHKYEREKFLKLLDVAAKYELAIYWKCNESIIEYLQKLSMSSDHRHRLNCVEFCGKMLVLDTTPDPCQGLDTTSLPREVDIIKILFERTKDKQDNVKLKALTSIKAGILNGNDFCKKIFNLVFKKTNDNPEIVTALGEEAEGFQQTLLALLQHSGATYIKKTCLEILTHHCDNLVDNEDFIDIIITLTDDPSYLVKIQLLELVNNLIKTCPNNSNAVETWLEVITNLIRDNDNKIVETALKSLIAIFQKIESFENTVTDEHILPWTIVKMILSKRKRGLLKSAIDTVASNFLTQEKLRNIETHIFTHNRTEAWCILSLIAKKMKSNNPDIIIKIFLDHMTDRNYDTNDFHLILEVIRNWIEAFSINSRTQMACKMREVLENGECPISMIAHLYEICRLTLASTSNRADENDRFAKHINDLSKQFILANFGRFHTDENCERLLSFILIYCESSADLPYRPDKKVLDHLFGFLRKVLGSQVEMSVQADIPRKLNVVIVCLTRFAIRDNELAADLSPYLASLLNKSVTVCVVKTTMQCLNDLCKKHTSTVAPVFSEIIFKLHSKNEEVRLCALANIYELVMQDFIKMKGRVLINLLVCLVDKNEIVQLKSQAAILSYTNDKNPNLLYSCFIEAVFLFNNFIQLDNFGVFPLDEIDKSLMLLHGEDKREQRRELYQFFVQNIHDLNEVQLVMLLKQIISIKDGLEKKKFKSNVCGISAFKDLLYVFKAICEKQGESKAKFSKAEGGNGEEYEEEEQVAQTSETAQKATGKKNKNQLTMNDAIQVVEKVIQIYPAFAKLMTEYDSSLKTAIDDLTLSIATNFASLIEYSKDNFWNCVKDFNDKSGKGRKRKKKVVAEDSDNDCSDDDL